jgi:ketosteroid isomerase-like protein
MKRLVAGAALAIVFVGITRAASDNAAKNEVIAAQKRFYEAYQSCDAKAMQPLVVGDLLYLHSTGSLQHNKEELLKGLTPNCSIQILRVDPEVVRVYGDTAVVFGRLHFKAKSSPEVQANLLAAQVFIKRNGKWLFVHNSSTEPVPLDSSIKLAIPKTP